MSKRFALNISVNRHGVNQFDVMMFGFCFYGRLPKWARVEQIHITAGVWKSRVFCRGEQCGAVVLFK